MKQNTKNVKQTVKNNLKQAKVDALAVKASKTKAEKTEKTKTQKPDTPKIPPEPTCTPDGDCCCPTPAAQ